MERLCAHYAADHLASEEFERRLDLAYQAGGAEALASLLTDLPELSDPLPGTPYEIARPGDVSGRQVVFALMGGNARSGAWTPPAPHGGHRPDGRGGAGLPLCALPAGVTEITCVALMGAVEIIVPPGCAWSSTASR